MSTNDPGGLPDWTRPDGYKSGGAPSSRRRRRWPWIAVAAIGAVVAVGLIAPDDTKQSSDQAAAVVATPSGTVTESSSAPGSSAPPSTTSEPPAPAPTSAAAIGSNTQAQAALTQLDGLAVKGRAPKTGYSRTQFGQAWSDDVDVDGGRNGCDTRNDILRRDLTGITVRPGTRGCVVLTGTLADPYTGTSVAFTRGAQTSDAVQIDHVVALSDAWQKGAQQLSPEKRRDLANDPRNLQATDGPTNQRKGDGDAATWLPPARAFRCTYVSRQVQVKSLYGLWVTQAEKDAITRVLTSCGAVSAPPPVPQNDTATRTQTPVPRPAPRYTPPPAAPVVPDGGDVYYRNCAAARAAGAAPIRAGEPGYRAGLDGDGDGTACDRG
ncbi:GmrSD restriction endonuclease domain-containing protein [Williamsia sp. MIQD14]|uniref:GmrSD restriction endonuclease domain-containing protein n=1 Tax=Williamsia sp. MIQD14 TaxID=3425703 RepID=UPI003DA191AA